MRGIVIVLCHFIVNTLRAHVVLFSSITIPFFYLWTFPECIPPYLFYSLLITNELLFLFLHKKGQIFSSQALSFILYKGKYNTTSSLIDNEPLLPQGGFYFGPA